MGSTLKILEILSIIPWSLCPIGVTIKPSAACAGGACAVALKGFADSKRSSNVFAWDSTFRLFGSRRLLRRTDDHHLALFSHLDRVQAGAVPRQVCGRARIWRERGAPSLTSQVLPVGARTRSTCSRIRPPGRLACSQVMGFVSYLYLAPSGPVLLNPLVAPAPLLLCPPIPILSLLQVQDFYSQCA